MTSPPIYPGVFITETLNALTNTISTGGVAAAAFVGEHSQGPVGPVLVSSWSQYQTYFGGFSVVTPGDYLTHAVYAYFANGGRQAYIVRAVASDAVASVANLEDHSSTPGNVISVTSKSPGAWGNGLYVDVTTANTGSDRFNLTVKLGGTTADKVVEVWNDVSSNPQSNRYFAPIINSASSGSNFVVVADSRDLTVPWVVANVPAVISGVNLAGGVDGANSVSVSDAVELLADIDQLLVLNLPGVTDYATINAVINWIDPGHTNFFLVIDSPSGASDATGAVADYTQVLTGSSAYTKTSYAAVYGPWLAVDDPAVSVAGATKLVPPGGSVVGVYSRTDASRGVNKPPAGITSFITGALATEWRFSTAQLGTLNDGGFNVIRFIPGAGICIMGARTLLQGFPSRYVSVRRTLMEIKKALLDNTRFAIFEPNNEDLWSKLRSIISQYLLTLYQTEVLSGTTADNSFYVKCDADNNPNNLVILGQVHIEVGVAISSPAEFVIIQIGQFNSGDSTATDSTATA